VTRVRTEDDILKLRLQDGFIVAEVDPALFISANIRNAERQSGPRLHKVVRSIMSKGYRPTMPITLRVGPDGVAEVLDGGHRITALRHILRHPIRRRLAPPISSVYVVVFVDKLSWTAEGAKMPEFLVEIQGNLPKTRTVQPRDSQTSWEHATQRMRAAGDGAG